MDLAVPHVEGSSRLQGFLPELMFEVEPTVRCNAYCIMCPREYTPKRKDLDVDTFRVVLDRIEEYPVGLLKIIHFCGLGEPSMHANIVEFAAMAHQRGIATSMQTNAKSLTPELSRELIDAGLSGFFVSVGGALKETYEFVLRGCKYENFVANVEGLLENKAGRDVIVTMALTPTHGTQAESRQIVERWRPRGVDFFFAEEGVVTRGGTVPAMKRPVDGAFESCDLGRQVELARDVGLDSWNAFVFSRLTREEYENFEAKNKFYCFLKDKLYYIGCDGQYYLGSCDYPKDYPLGNVREHSIADMVRIKADLEPTKMCLECADYEGLYGLNFDELQPIVESQEGSRRVYQRVAEIALRKGYVTLT